MLRVEGGGGGQNKQNPQSNDLFSPFLSDELILPQAGIDVNLDQQ